jgi:hypothetical protein
MVDSAVRVLREPLLAHAVACRQIQQQVSIDEQQARTQLKLAVEEHINQAEHDTDDDKSDSDVEIPDLVLLPDPVVSAQFELDDMLLEEIELPGVATSKYRFRDRSAERRTRVAQRRQVKIEEFEQLNKVLDIPAAGVDDIDQTCMQQVTAPSETGSQWTALRVRVSMMQPKVAEEVTRVVRQWFEMLLNSALFTNVSIDPASTSAGQANVESTTAVAQSDFKVADLFSSPDAQLILSIIRSEAPSKLVTPPGQPEVSMATGPVVSVQETVKRSLKGTVKCPTRNVLNFEFRMQQVVAEQLLVLPNSFNILQTRLPGDAIRGMATGAGAGALPTDANLSPEQKRNLQMQQQLQYQAHLQQFQQQLNQQAASRQQSAETIPSTPSNQTPTPAPTPVTAAPTNVPAPEQIESPKPTVAVETKQPAPQPATLESILSSQRLLQNREHVLTQRPIVIADDSPVKSQSTSAVSTQQKPSTQAPTQAPQTSKAIKQESTKASKQTTSQSSQRSHPVVVETSRSASSRSVSPPPLHQHRTQERQSAVVPTLLTAADIEMQELESSRKRKLEELMTREAMARSRYNQLQKQYAEVHQLVHI